MYHFKSQGDNRSPFNKSLPHGELLKGRSQLDVWILGMGWMVAGVQGSDRSTVLYWDHLALPRPCAVGMGAVKCYSGWLIDDYYSERRDFYVSDTVVF